MPETRLLVELGIGETREALVEDGRIIEAMIKREGVVPAGTVLEARLKSVRPRCIAVADGQQYLLPAGAPGFTEGAMLRIEVVREAIGGAEAWKLALARMADQDETRQAGPEPVEARDRELDELGWEDLIDEARSGIVRFRGGELRVFVTPAMTLIDVDGTLPPDELAIAGARAAAAAIRRHGIGGSIGIDLPTVEGKARRQAAAQAFDSALPLPFERTAVNGFGFLQVIRPRRRASLFELAAETASFEARALLRIAGREIGSHAIVAHPSVVAAIEARPHWIDQLSRQVGGNITLRSEPSLSISGGHVEAN